MKRYRPDPAILLLAGIFTGIILAIVNNYCLSLTVTVDGFRLHHIWIGLVLSIIGGLTKFTFLIGLGAILMVDDWIRHQTPTGIAPFW